MPTIPPVTTAPVGLDPTEIVTVIRELATPDPVFTSESWASGIATIIGILYVVIFHQGLPGTVQAALVTVLTFGWSAFTLYHAKGVRAARALGQGIAESAATQVAIKP